MLEDEIKVEIAALSLEIIDGDPKEIFNYTLDYIEKLETKLLKLNKDFNRLSSERSEALSASFFSFFVFFNSQIVLNELF